MNYLKSISTAVLNSTGVSFPFAIGERISGLDPYSSIWEIRDGVKKDDSTPLTLFIFDSTLPPLNGKDRKSLLHLARNALKKLRTIRHPDVLKYIDSVETETHVYIATERVRPLEGVLRDWETGGALSGSSASKGKGREDWVGWGIRAVSTALAFLNAPPLSVHHSYLLPSAIFVTPAMEWRLAGFDLLTTRDDPAGILWGMGGLAPGGLGERCAPEVKKGGWGVLRDTDPSQSDTYLFALLLFNLFNPNTPLPSLAAQPSPSSAGSIPKTLFPLWKRMLNPNPRTRLTTIAFVPEATATGFWSSNPLANLVDALDGFELKSEGEKLALLRTIKEAAPTIPAPFLLYKVLPSLLHSLSLPTAPSGAMLPLVLELGKLVPPSDYGKLVLDPVVKLYASQDRGTRMALLDGLDQYADRMDNRTVTDRVWPHLLTGFADTVPVIREATVKAVFPLASKLSDRILNNDLLRLLAKMQTDTEPSIRTNTCILLGRLAPTLSTNTKKKVLVPAFARSLKDPFVHARVAGLMAFMATVDIFDRDDLAGKVIPNMAFTMIDREKLVRDQAFKAMGMFMKRLEDAAAAMPETVSAPEERSISGIGPVTTTSAANGSGQAGLVNSAAGAAGALAGWAITSLSKQLATSEAHSSLSAAPSGLTVPSSNGFGSGTSPLSSPATSPRPSEDGFAFGSTAGPSKPSINVKKAPKAALPSASSGSSGMKLGAAKKPAVSTSVADSVAAEWEDDGSAANAWGNDDLIDVNADEDDWAAFESAPVPEIVVPPPQSYYVSAPASSPVPPAPVPVIKRAASPQPSPPKPKPPAIARPVSPAPSKLSQQTTSPRQSQDGWGDVDGPGDTKAAAPSLASMSKEEKDKEMARRREERKARIAAMKEQKKGKA